MAQPTLDFEPGKLDSCDVELQVSALGPRVCGVELHFSAVGLGACDVELHVSAVGL